MFLFSFVAPWIIFYDFYLYAGWLVIMMLVALHQICCKGCILSILEYKLRKEDEVAPLSARILGHEICAGVQIAYTLLVGALGLLWTL